VEINLFVIVGIIICVMIFGNYFTQLGMVWYHSSLRLPSITPPDWVFGPVWTCIYVMLGICMYRVWNYFPRDYYMWATVGLFFLNMVLNGLWSYLFFTRHALGWAFFDTLALVGTVVGMMFCIAQYSVFTATLLLPYVVWGIYASYLNYVIWLLNV
jgi:benzodiazapine receptor